MNFLGYRRANGKVGTRNHVGIISTVVCANAVTQRIANLVEGAVAFVHSQGCCQTALDLEIVNRTLINLGVHPNLGAVLLVALGCESVNLELVHKAIAESGKPVQMLLIQEEGGLHGTIAKGVQIATEFAAQLAGQERQQCSLDNLCIGIKCGGSDTTSGIISNPVLGNVADQLVASGGTVVVGEITEFLGAEHIVAARIEDDTVRTRFLRAVNTIEERVLATGTDMRGSQPTRGNIAGGLTTIEEKSLGAAVKAGKSPVRQVLDYGCQCTETGLVIVDSPAREPELLTALAAAGAQIIFFTTGRGAPQGFPFVPVLKVTGNKRTYDKMKDHMDVCIAPSAFSDLQAASLQVMDLLVLTANGQLTAAEVLEYDTGDIAVIGPII